MVLYPRVTALALAGVLAALVVAGCAPVSTPEPAASESHVHSGGPNREHITPLVGDGTRSTAFDYTLQRVSLPRVAGQPGRVSFRIVFEGRPVTDYIVQQTKDLHLYVVRKDLRVFRHLHPVLGSDGVWSAPVTLPEPGEYRVIAEFVARADAESGEAVMIGRSGIVGGKPSGGATEARPAEVTAEIEGDLRTGADGTMSIVVRHTGGGPVQLGDYLGTAAHVTAFHRRTGAVAHLHPLGAPVVDQDGSRLSFHTVFQEPGDYLCFVQVRVDGFLHTLELPATVV